MTVAVVIGTYGEERWLDQAMGALRSVLRQTVPPDSVVYVHGASLAEARNAGARATGAEWLIFLDADDTLDTDYIRAMLAGDGDLRQPATLGVYPDGHTDTEAVLIPPKPLIDGNYMVIGTMVRAELFHKVGGFRELAMYEDWDLWIRCWLAGATIGACPGAIYRVGVNEAGRNNQDHALQLATYNQIRSEHLTAATAR